MALKTTVLNQFRKLFMFRPMELLLISLLNSKLFSRSFISKIVPNNYQYKKKSFRNITRNSINLNVDISDYVGHYLYFNFYDPGYLQLFKLPKKGDVVIDIGANIGYTTLNFASIVGEKGQVISFEPDEFNYNEFLKNIKKNNFVNVIPNNLGLGAVPENVKLAVHSPDNLGMNRIDRNASDNFSVINIITLDSYIEKNNISKVDLIKIDVEGFELNVLKGGINSLKKFKPILYIELDNNNLKQQGNSALELVMFLASLNYSIVNALTNSTITFQSDFTNCHYDIICKTSAN
jgi:FkbM family methyltransferase